MVLAFTEEQKKYIEENGMTVSEVKITVHKATKLLNWLVGTVRNVLDNMDENLLEEVRQALRNRTEQEKISGIADRDDRHYTPPSLLIKEKG